MHYGNTIEELIASVSRAERKASLVRVAAGSLQRPNLEERLLPAPPAGPMFFNNGIGAA